MNLGSGIKNMELKLNNISFAYENHEVIKNMDCSFVSGNFYSILGPNGSGKTTLLDLISGFLNPCAGAVYKLSKS